MADGTTVSPYTNRISRYSNVQFKCLEFIIGWYMPAGGAQKPCIYSKPVIQCSINTFVRNIIIEPAVSRSTKERPCSPIGNNRYCSMRSITIFGSFQVFRHPDLCTYCYSIIGISIDISQLGIKTEFISVSGTNTVGSISTYKILCAL